MIKTIYICDFCKKEVKTEKDLIQVKVPYLENLYGIISTPLYSICGDCYQKLGEEVKKLLKPRSSVN